MPLLRLLGGVFLDGKHGGLTGRAAQRHRLALLAILAVSHPRPVGRDKLMAYLWPESDTRHARNLLNQAVHALRRALGKNAIRSEGDELELNPEIITADVWLFEEALAASDPQRAVDLYRGPFLDGFFLGDSLEFERWSGSERDRLQRAYLKALEELAEGASAQGDWQAAADWWRRLAAEEPYNSHITLRFMEVLEAAGDRAGAINQARVHSELLRTEFEAEPSPEVVALAERMRLEPDEGPEGALPQAENLPPSGAAEALEERAPAAPRPGRSRKVAWSLVALAILAATGWAITKASSGGGSPEIRRLAVLPMANFTGNPEHDYFVAGMHDALVTELGKIADLTVISRQSVLRYEGSDKPMLEIARELGVDALVEGSVFLAGDSVRVTAQLIRASPEEHLWADSYRGTFSEALALQGEVASAIAQAVHARVTPAERARLASAHAVSPEAQEAYLRGLHFVDQHALGSVPGGRTDESIRTAIAYLEKAVELDPEWPRAHAKLALAYHWLASSFPDDAAAEFFPKSKAAALRALELDPREAQAYASLGFVLFRHERDWAGAERAIRRALELESNEGNHWIYGLYLLGAGRYEEAITHFRQAEELNPLSAVLKGQLGFAYFCARRYDETIDLMEYTLQLWPDDTPAFSRFLLGHAYSAMSMHPEAIAEFERSVALSDSAPSVVSELAYIYARAGREGEARALLQWLQERPGWNAPYLYVALNEIEPAVAMTEAAVRERRLPWFRCLPEWEVLRTEPRVRESMHRIGLPD